MGWGFDSLHGDGGQLADLVLGQDREEVFVKVTVVPGSSGVEDLQASGGDGNGDRSAVGGARGSAYEPIGFQPDHDA